MMLRRLAILVSLACSCSAESWYKGILHAHSYWSDGDVPPEEAIAWYRDRGYDFMSLTDHQLLQTDTNRWKTVPEAVYTDYVQRNGADWGREQNKKKQIRLKTFSELSKLFNSKKFRLIPGNEANRKIGDTQTHMNIINGDRAFLLPENIASFDGFVHVEKEVRDYAKKNKRPMLYMLNHPDWVYFDVQPEILLALPQVKFYEICNSDGGPMFKPHPQWYNRDKFFDIVNAFRAEDGVQPLYGLGTDDAHSYRNPKGSSAPGHAWVMVRSDSLDVDALISAMERGDFYASTGVTLADVRFSRNTLRVNVNPEVGATYTIEFFTTKKGFDRTTITFEDPAHEKKPARVGKRYSDSIGCIVKTVKGTEAEYTLAADDLYVRARITSSLRPEIRASNEPEFTTAWTQPYRPRKGWF